MVERIFEAIRTSKGEAASELTDAAKAGNQERLAAAGRLLAALDEIRDAAGAAARKYGLNTPSSTSTDGNKSPK